MGAIDTAIRDKLRKMNPKHVTALMFLLPVAMVAVFIYLIYAPMNKANENLNIKIRKNESEVSEGLVMQRKLRQLINANAQLQAELKAATELLPGSDEEAKFPDTITQMVKAAGLTYKSLTPGKKVAGQNGMYFETPMVLECSGTYHDFGKFMEAIDGIRRLLTVSDINMSSAKLEGKKMVIPIKATISVFSAGGGGK